MSAKSLIPPTHPPPRRPRGEERTFKSSSVISFLREIIIKSVCFYVTLWWIVHVIFSFRNLSLEHHDLRITSRRNDLKDDVIRYTQYCTLLLLFKIKFQVERKLCKCWVWFLVQETLRWQGYKFNPTNFHHLTYPSNTCFCIEILEYPWLAVFFVPSNRWTSNQDCEASDPRDKRASITSKWQVKTLTCKNHQV